MNGVMMINMFKKNNDIYGPTRKDLNKILKNNIKQKKDEIKELKKLIK